jgi:hypothetical protein
MSRNRLKKELNYGLFNAKINKIENYTLFMEDIITNYEFEINFEITNKPDKTKSNAPIWVNQLGEIGYGKKEDLLKQFTHFPNGTEKKYREAVKGDVYLASFLRVYHNPNIYNTRSNIYNNLNYMNDPYDFKLLFNTDNEYSETVGGIIYINTNYEEKIFPIFIPHSKLSILKNTNGDLSEINDNSLFLLKNKLMSEFKPKGYYHFGNIKTFIV